MSNDNSTAALTLPGSIQGLLRRCSPVIRISSGGRSVVIGHLGMRAVAIAGESTDGSAPRDDLGLDLTAATGRTHAASWLATKVQSWPLRAYRRALLSGEAQCSAANRAGRFTGVRFLIWCCCNAWADHGAGLSPKRRVAGLEGLDPNDPRLLPDGSRWVDAEALRLVCLHVWGVKNG